MAELLGAQMLAKETSLSGILFAALMAIGLDGSPAKVITTRWYIFTVHLEMFIDEIFMVFYGTEIENMLCFIVFEID